MSQCSYKSVRGGRPLIEVNSSFSLTSAVARSEMFTLKLADGDRGAAVADLSLCALQSLHCWEPRSRRAEVIRLAALFSSALCSSWGLWECPICFEARYQVCPGCAYGAGMACLCLTPPGAAGAVLPE